MCVRIPAPYCRSWGVGESRPMRAQGLEQFASMAHDLWRDRMRINGWRYGPVFDLSLRTHDALRAFEELSPTDQQHAREATRASGAIELLSACINYPRGPEAPTPLNDLGPRARVRLIQTDRIEGIKVGARDIGIVQEVIREAGRAVRVVVQWPSGDRTLHTEADGDLALVPEM